jgi:hypothetical protein
MDRKTVDAMTADEVRFWKKVDRRGSDECWEWKAGKVRSYGQFRFNRKSQYAHRVSYILAFGNIPDGMNVCHKCDNPGCVNPNHLFLGTQLDNIRDREIKGRGKTPDQSGENNSQSKLRLQQVEEIREKYNHGVNKKELATMYSVSRQTINHVIIGDRWNGRRPI